MKFYDFWLTKWYHLKTNLVLRSKFDVSGELVENVPISVSISLSINTSLKVLLSLMLRRFLWVDDVFPKEFLSDKIELTSKSLDSFKKGYNLSFSNWLFSYQILIPVLRYLSFTSLLRIQPPIKMTPLKLGFHDLNLVNLNPCKYQKDRKIN